MALLYWLQYILTDPRAGAADVVLYVNPLCAALNIRTVFLRAGTDAPAIVNCLHILARSLDARFCILLFFFYMMRNIIKMFVVWFLFFQCYVSFLLTQDSNEVGA